MSALLYVYGIVPADAAPAVEGAGLEGIEATRVHALVEGPFAAAESTLDESEYGAETLNKRVQDLEWLTPRATAHQHVNARLLDLAGAVLPLAFGALYRDESRVREMLREDVATRAARLASLAGRAEWVVTVTREPTAVPGADDDLRELDREIASSAPGKAFLLEKRRTNVAHAATARADADAARRALDALERASERAYREPVAAGGADVVVLRVSLLGPRASTAIADTVAQLGDELSAEGYRVRASGPWPAYRFGSLA
jgi:hypothetical protein